jgi:hypothetical protein
LGWYRTATSSRRRSEKHDLTHRLSVEMRSEQGRHPVSSWPDRCIVGFVYLRRDPRAGMAEKTSQLAKRKKNLPTEFCRNAWSSEQTDDTECEEVKKKSDGTEKECAKAEPKGDGKVVTFFQCHVYS